MTVLPPRVLALVLALVLGFGAAYATACGEEDKGLLTAGKADSIRTSLDDIDEFVSSGRCDKARAALAELRRKLDTLPESTDPRLAERLEQGAGNLAEIVPGECGENRTATQQTQTQTTETTPTETVAPEPTPTETVPEPTPTTPTPTTPTPTTPTPTTPAPTTPTPTPAPDGSGGGAEAPAASGSGRVTPGQAKKGEGR
jgi:hypothetical protein